MHEHTQRYITQIQSSSNRTFGLVFSTMLAIIATYPLLGGGPIRIWPLFIAVIFLLLALAAPQVLATPNKIWTRLGDLLHRIASPLALGIVFYVTVLPTGLLLRLFNKDPLRLRFDRNATSYWIKREPPGPTAESLNNQF